MQRSSYHGGQGDRVAGRDDQLGLCALHNKKRKIFELVPLPGQPGQFRCQPTRECFARDVADFVTCSLHGNKRNKAQCHLKSEGVYECLPRYPCRAKTGTAQPGRGYDGQGGARDDFGTLQSNFRTAGAPVRGAVAFGAAVYEATATEVWCAIHGKKVLQAYCRLTDATYFECTDNSTCVSSQLEAPASLVAKGCTSLICSTHGRLRRARYLVVNETGAGYSCAEGHECILRRGRGGDAVDIGVDEDGY